MCWLITPPRCRRAMTVSFRAVTPEHVQSMNCRSSCRLPQALWYSRIASPVTSRRFLLKNKVVTLAWPPPSTPRLRLPTAVDNPGFPASVLAAGCHHPTGQPRLPCEVNLPNGPCILFRLTLGADLPLPHYRGHGRPGCGRRSTFALHRSPEQNPVRR